MTIQDFMDKWFDEGTSEYTEAEEELRRIRLEARGAVLSVEDRRVWCEDYARSLLLFQSPETAEASANGKLAAYREARAAWDARKEKG